ncbi:antibiotic biosynthesis monooxygenase [Segnochrobactrum spirostomi]|nr:antibiotic biosynthesis monooxygenase [Segnochrobactrum spirostomi]
MHISVRPGIEAAFATWQAALTRAASAADGFVSIEFQPVAADGTEWRTITRFRSAEALAAWQSSGRRAEAFASLSPLLAKGGAPVDDILPEFDASSGVTEVITTAVTPEREAEFLAWAERMQARQATFPGYLGTVVQAPLSSDLPYWTTLVRFATPGELEAWLASPDRKALIESADPAVSRFKARRLDDAFASWFADDAAVPPPRWKQTALVLLVLFPVVMLEIRFLSPHLAGLPLPVATFIGNAISVSLVAWPLMAIAIVVMRWWLHAAPAGRARTEALGAATLLCLYAIEIAVFTLT